MDEASSKYVDQISADKLLNEKLKRVHHAPSSVITEQDGDFSDFGSLDFEGHDPDERENNGVVELSFTSLLPTAFPENNRVKCSLYKSDKGVGQIILVHGLYEENPDIYKYFVGQLNKAGMDVWLMTLPYHYSRKPAGSLFSGEYFWSADINRSVLAFKQAVYDLNQVYRFIKNKYQGTTLLAGFSMGGGIALVLSALTRLDAVFCINPVCNIAELVWTSALFSTIKSDLILSGISIDEIRRKFAHFEPLELSTGQTDPAQIAVGKGLYDQINQPQNYELLAAHWNLENVIAYKAGHLNILRVPKLALDLVHFYRKNFE